MFIIVLLAIPVVIRFEYGEQLYLRVRYLFITLYRMPAKPKRAKKKRGKQEKKPEPPKQEAAPPPEASLEKADKKKKKEKKEKNPKIPTLYEIFELVKVFVDSLSKPLKKLLRRIKILDFDLRMICGGDDAAKAAIKFGTVNLVVGNALGQLGSWFTIKDPHIDINVDFQSEKTTTQCSCTVKTSALVMLIFVFNFLGRLLWRVARNDRILGYLGRLKGEKKPKKKKKKSK